jgi:hypothetical protein
VIYSEQGLGEKDDEVETLMVEAIASESFLFLFFLTLARVVDNMLCRYRVGYGMLASSVLPPGKKGIIRHLSKACLTH